VKTEHHNDFFDNIIKSKNITITIHTRHKNKCNETLYLRTPRQHTTKATADQLRMVSNSPRHRRRQHRRSRLLNQRCTQQDHWQSTHDTEDNIMTGRDVPRTDGSAVPPNNVLPRSRQRSWRIRKNVPTQNIWHDCQENPARTVISRRARASDILTRL